MARKAIPANPPRTLDDHIFYGLQLDEEQKAFRDAIWELQNPNHEIVFVNAKAGTGKNLISIATAILMVEYKLFDEIVYITAAGVHEYKQGLLPGTIEDKSRMLMQPLYQTVANLGYNPDDIIKSENNMMNQKYGSAFITCMTDSYVRGMNIGSETNKCIVILDESQNWTLNGLKTILTRINDGSKAIVIGHDKQCDLKYCQDSGFIKFIMHFQKKNWCKICTLTKNYRGKISEWADEI